MGLMLIMRLGIKEVGYLDFFFMARIQMPAHWNIMGSADPLMPLFRLCTGFAVKKTKYGWTPGEGKWL